MYTRIAPDAHSDAFVVTIGECQHSVDRPSMLMLIDQVQGAILAATGTSTGRHRLTHVGLTPTELIELDDAIRVHAPTGTAAAKISRAVTRLYDSNAAGT